MISPRFFKGVKIADLAPTIILNSSSQIFFHIQFLEDLDSFECHTATISPNTALNLPAICGVVEISGKSTTADLPCLIACLAASIKTSVLPLPVTPCNKNGSNIF